MGVLTTLSMGKYVNVLVSFGWAIGSLIYNKFFLKKMNKIIEGMPNKLTFILCLLYIIDNYLSFKNGF